MLSYLLTASKKVEGIKCDGWTEGAKITVDNWAVKDFPDSTLPPLSSSCSLYNTESLPLKKETFLEASVKGHLLYEKEHHDHDVVQGYVVSMNYFLDSDSEADKYDSGYYKPNSSAFKDTYHMLMDECVARCHLISNQKCLHSFAYARVYNAGSMSNESQEMANFTRVYNTYSGAILDDKQTYFQCSYLDNSWTIGTDPYKILQVELSADNYYKSFYSTNDDHCVDGDMYASHLISYDGFDLNSDKGLKVTTIGKKRETFCDQMGDMCIALEANRLGYTDVQMSSPVPFSLKNDPFGNPLTMYLWESYTIIAASMGQMNEFCLADVNCIGYNFTALDKSSSDWDPFVGANYEMTVFTFLGHPDEILTAAVEYYGRYQDFHRDDAKDRIFYDESYINDGRVGMVLKMTDCSNF